MRAIRVLGSWVDYIDMFWDFPMLAPLPGAALACASMTPLLGVWKAFSSLPKAENWREVEVQHPTHPLLVAISQPATCLSCPCTEEHSGPPYGRYRVTRDQ